MRLAVLASGSGTILEAILAAELPVAVVASDRACRAVRVAMDAGVPCELVVRDRFDEGFDRDAYTEALLARLDEHRPDAVAMAGFMTILGPAMFEVYGGRVLNTHPSLLPAFPGARAVADALAAGVGETGCTVHLATEVVDDGPVLATARVPVLASDDEARLHERIKAAERDLYPRAIAGFLADLERSGSPRP